MEQGKQRDGYPVIASIASTIRAICRTVVIFISVVRQRINGRIVSMVLVLLSLSGFDYQRYHKNHARFPASFGEGIDKYEQNYHLGSAHSSSRRCPYLRFLVYSLAAAYSVRRTMGNAYCRRKGSV